MVSPKKIILERDKWCLVYKPQNYIDDIIFYNVLNIVAKEYLKNLKVEIILT